VIGRFADRIGRALVAPRRALADADHGDGGGAPDALVLLLLKVLCGEARFLVAAVWTLIVVGPGPAMSALAMQLSATIGLDLILILGGGVLITLAAGRRRAPSRDFDLACTAWVPVLVIDVAASLVTLVGDFELPAIAQQILWVVALGWMAVLLALAVATARRRA
jgi:hypothetical protein